MSVVAASIAAGSGAGVGEERRDAQVVSIAQARRRLRPHAGVPVAPSSLESTVARHPAGSQLGRPASPASIRPPALAAGWARPALGVAAAPLAQTRGEGRALSWVPRLARVVVLALATLLLFAAALGAGLLLRPAPYAGETWTHSVAAGESVWGIAGSLQLERPLEDVVEDIVQMNALSDMTLHAGQTLTVPAE